MLPGWVQKLVLPLTAGQHGSLALLENRFSLKKLQPAPTPPTPVKLLCQLSRGPGLEFLTCPWPFLEVLWFTGNHKYREIAFIIPLIEHCQRLEQGTLASWLLLVADVCTW